MGFLFGKKRGREDNTAGQELCPHGEDLATEQTLNFMKTMINTPGANLDREAVLDMFSKKLGWTPEETEKFRRLLIADGM